MRLAYWFLGLAALGLAAPGCGHKKTGSLADTGAPDAPHADASLDGAVEAGTDASPDAGIAAPHIIRVTTADVDDVDDGLCSLWEAIAASNSHAAVNTDDCPAGTGNDVIELPPGGHQIALTLEPTESMEIRGAGVGKTTIVFTGSTLACGVRVSTPGKKVWLTNLTLRPTAVGTIPGRLTGVCVTAGTVRIRHARVNRFTAGGLRAETAPEGEAKIEVYNSLIDGNTNRDDGAGIAFVGSGSWISVEQSAIVNNTTEGMGGGVFAWGGTNANYIINTTISGNVARRGGGVGARILDLTYVGLVWSTVVHNRALEIGGGLYLEASAEEAGHSFATGSIITGNTADDDAAQANLNADWGSSFSCTFSIFDLSGFARRPASFLDSCKFDLPDARLGPLMDMGGADHLPVHALLPGSPAIDAIDEARSLQPLEQRDTWNDGAGDSPLGEGPDDTPPWMIFGRVFPGLPLADIGAYEFNPRWETELLAVAEISAVEHGVVTTPAGLSHGAGTRIKASAAGAFVTYQVPVPEAARYAISVRMKTASDAGRWALLVSDAVGGPYVPVGAMTDSYSAADDWRTSDLGAVEFSSVGQKFFRFVVMGKNDASSGYSLFPDFLAVTKQ